MKFDEDRADEYIESAKPQFIHPACYGMMLEAMRWQHEQDKDLLDRAMKLLETANCWIDPISTHIEEAECSKAIYALLGEYRGEA